MDQKKALPAVTTPKTDESPDNNQLIDNHTTIVDFLRDKEAVTSLQNLIETVMERTHRGNNAERLFRMIGLVVIVAAIIGLSVFDKLDPSAGVILGSIAGYLFGKDND